MYTTEDKNVQTRTDEFSVILTFLKQSPLKIESDRGTEFYKKNFQRFLEVQTIHLYSRFTDKGRSTAERVIGTISNLFKKPAFEKRNANWLSEPSAVNKH